MTKLYKISVKTLQGRLLTFKVNGYQNEYGLIVFEDRLTKKVKRFPTSSVEIDEVYEDE